MKTDIKDIIENFPTNSHLIANYIQDVDLHLYGDDIDDDDIPSVLKYNRNKKMSLFKGDDSISIETVKEFGGMDQGSEYWVVFKITDNRNSHGIEHLFRCDGWYASYHGGEFDDPWEWKVVKPVIREVTFYE